MSVIRWLVVQEVCSRFEFARHFESHFTRPPLFYMLMQTRTTSVEHSIAVPPSSTDSFCVLCTEIRELYCIIWKSARVDLEVSCDQITFDLCPRAVRGEVWRRATLVEVSVTVSLRS